MKKHLLTLATLTYRNPNANVTVLRIWDLLICDYEPVWEGMLDEAPTKYLHKPIYEWYPNTDGISVFY